MTPIVASPQDLLVIRRGRQGRRAIGVYSRLGLHGGLAERHQGDQAIQ